MSKRLIILIILAGCLIFLLNACSPVVETPVSISSGMKLPIYSGLTPLPPDEAKTITTPIAETFKDKGLNFDILAFSTEEKVGKISAFYIDTLKDWKAIPPVLDPVAKTTTVKFIKPSGETYALIYTANNPPATNFLVVLIHLWK